jgi:superfamily II DNA helicase RecQ
MVDCENLPTPALLSKLQRGCFTHLFITIEQLVRDDALADCNGTVVALCLDEAHCVEVWENIKAAYKKIAYLRKRIGMRVPLVLLSATVSPATFIRVSQKTGSKHLISGGRARVMRRLQLNANLQFDCTKFQRMGANVDDRLAAVPAFIPAEFTQLLIMLRCVMVNGTPQEMPKVVIFCDNTTQVAQVFEFFMGSTLYDYPQCKYFDAYVGAYMGSTFDGTKESLQARLDAGTCRLFICTSAWGMGMDQPDIRWVLIYGIPRTLEGLIQQAGRAGRDGLKAKVTVIWTNYDLRRASKSLREFIQGDGTDRFCRRMCALRHLEHETASQIRRRFASEVKPGLDCANSPTPCDCCRVRNQRAFSETPQTFPTLNGTNAIPTASDFPLLAT